MSIKFHYFEKQNVWFEVTFSFESFYANKNVSLIIYVMV